MFTPSSDPEIIKPNKFFRKIKEKKLHLMAKDPLKRGFNPKVMTSC
jgi:hypothetical protein